VFEVAHETHIEILDNVVESEVDLRANVADIDFALDAGGEQVNAEIGPGFLGPCGRYGEQCQ
jgi:hypothetical protein